MKMVIGLGNPGPKYEKTRHNMGFMVIDELADRHHFKLNKNEFEAKYAEVNVKGEKVLFVQPQTFMNLSGKAVKALQVYFGVDIDELVVIYDDLDIPVGNVKFRNTGGPGGHNGMKSIIDLLGTNKFKRVRMGIGRPDHSGPVVNYVIGRVPKEEKPNLKRGIAHAADGIEHWLDGYSFDDTMSKYND